MRADGSDNYNDGECDLVEVEKIGDLDDDGDARVRIQPRSVRGNRGRTILPASLHDDPRNGLDSTKNAENASNGNRDEDARGEISHPFQNVLSASSFAGDAESSPTNSPGGSAKFPVGRKPEREVATRDVLFEQHLECLNTKFDKVWNEINATVFY